MQTLFLQNYLFQNFNSFVKYKNLFYGRNIFGVNVWTYYTLHKANLLLLLLL